MGSGRGGGPGGSKGLSGGRKEPVGAEVYERRNVEVSDGSKNSTEKRDASGLNPNRIRGFGNDSGNSRVDTPSLNEMRAKQGAIVAKFMTFFKRKSSVVIEMYEACFFKEKPRWDQIANFVYHDLCPNDTLRKAVKDVQLHPVKMVIFVRFSSDSVRDEVVRRIQSGIIWTDYHVKVKGYSLDSEVKFIRLLGASPETEAPEIVKVFKEIGIGDVIEIKKGMLDSIRLPGVTNGTWSLRVKIADPSKAIPSYIHRRDEGELWSLNFEGRLFCCWKCGSNNHIGDKCRDQNRTFEEIFSADNNGFVQPTWAAVVRSGNGDTEEHRKRVAEVERRITEENLRKANQLKEIEETRKLQAQEAEAKEKESERLREQAILEAEAVARAVTKTALAENGDIWEGVSDTDLLGSEIQGSFDSLHSTSPSAENIAVLDMKNILLPAVSWFFASRGRLALEHHPSQEQVRGKKRLKINKNAVQEENVVETAPDFDLELLNLYESDFSSDSSEALSEARGDRDCKKIRLEEEEALWDEAISQTSNLVKSDSDANEAVMKEEVNVLQSSSHSEGAENGHKGTKNSDL